MKIVRYLIEGLDLIIIRGLIQTESEIILVNLTRFSKSD